jgi:hypothetical protein
LERFRPAGAPGAATAAAVPADRRAAARAELEPVFAALSDDIARAGAERDALMAEAARRRAEGQDAARALVARAQAAADGERAAERARLRGISTAATRAAQERAAARARAVRERAGRRRAALVAAVVERVRADIEELGSDERGAS